MQTIPPMRKKKKIEKSIHSRTACSFHSRIYQNSIITRSVRCTYPITCAFEKGRINDTSSGSFSLMTHERTLIIKQKLRKGSTLFIAAGFFSNIRYPTISIIQESIDSPELGVTKYDITTNWLYRVFRHDQPT